MSNAIDSLVERIQHAKDAYYRGEPTMTDDEYDALYRELKKRDPSNPILSMVAAPVGAGEAVPLPIPMPSLEEVQPEALARWLSNNNAPTYHISEKLDGISCLWMPNGKLYTHGSALKGRDITAFVPLIKSLVPSKAPVRGELIIKKNSSYVPEGKLARNIVAGIFSRKGSFDERIFKDVEFVAFDLLVSEKITPTEAFRQLQRMGFKTAGSVLMNGSEMTDELLRGYLSNITSDYQLDGIVMVPNIPRCNLDIEVRNNEAVSPKDKASWKTKLTVESKQTIVTDVIWQVSATGRIKPVVHFVPVTLSGATISQATGIHETYIRTSGIGKGAVIIVTRSKDVIPRILEVVEHVTPAKPDIPYKMKGVEAVALDETDEQNIARLRKSLDNLNAKDVGPATVANLYQAGFETIRNIYQATASDFAGVLAGVKDKMADKIYNGLRNGKETWNELAFMVASNVFPELVGKSKLGSILTIFPDPTKWDEDAILANRPSGVSPDVIHRIMRAMPDYLKWYNDNIDGVLVPKGERERLTAAREAEPAAAADTGNERKLTLVLTGFTDPILSLRYNVKDNFTKEADYVVYRGTLKESTKSKKAREYNIPIIEVGSLP